MQVSVEAVGALGRKLKVAVPAENVEKEFNQRLKKLSQQVRCRVFVPAGAAQDGGGPVRAAV